MKSSTSNKLTRSMQTNVFFFNHTTHTEIYTLSLHDALPISASRRSSPGRRSPPPPCQPSSLGRGPLPDRKSTRLNSSHEWISYAVFCLKKKTRNDACWLIKEKIEIQ